MSEQDLSIPVVAIDGGAATGKGTVRHIVAVQLRFLELDSGALYRALALQCDELGVDPSKTEDVVLQARELKFETRGDQLFLQGKERTQDLRSERAGDLAKVIAAILEVREALKGFQLSMRRRPGLVADGRDMGELFDTPHRYYLEVSPEKAADRRVSQLHCLGQKPKYQEVLAGIKARDFQDRHRSVSPLRQHPLATKIVTDRMSAEQVAKKILREFFFHRQGRRA